MLTSFGVLLLALALVLIGLVTASSFVAMEAPVNQMTDQGCPDMDAGHADTTPDVCSLKCALACHFLSTLLTPERNIWRGSDAADVAATGRLVSGPESFAPRVPTPPPDFG